MKIYGPVRNSIVVALILAGAGPANAADYVIDSDHTSIHFKVGHFQFSRVQGRFNRISGRFSFEPAS
jgi:polyisoprenoid-binding protein YceI